MAHKEKLPISVCVLTHNNFAAIDRCLRAVMEHGDCAEILVLENGCDYTIDFDGVKTVRSGHNLGCPTGRNEIAKYATQKYILWLDDDQYVSPGSVQGMWDATQNGQVDFVGTIACATDKHGVGRPRNCLSDISRAYLGGGGALCRKDVFDALDGFDDAFSPAYCSDADFFWRLRDAGYTVAHVPGAGIEHEEHSTMHTQKTFNEERQHSRSHRILRSKWSDRLERRGDDKDFAVMVLTYKDFSRFEEYMNANIQKLDWSKSRLYVLLNGVENPGEYIEYFDTLDIDLEYYISETNLSCAPGRAYLTGQIINRSECKYYFFLDDDIKLMGDGVEAEAESIFDDDGRVGCIHGVLVDDAGLIVGGASAYRKKGEWGETTTAVRRIVKRHRERLPGKLQGGLSATAPGGFCILKRRVIESVYRYLNLFPAGFADFDMSFRMRVTGHKIYFAPDIRGVHETQKTWRRPADALMASTVRLKTMWGVIHAGVFAERKNDFQNELADMGMTPEQIITLGFRNASENFNNL